MIVTVIATVTAAATQEDRVGWVAAFDSGVGSASNQPVRRQVAVLRELQAAARHPEPAPNQGSAEETARPNPFTSTHGSGAQFVALLGWRQSRSYRG